MARTVWKIIGSSAFRGREFNSATEAARALYLSGVEWAPEYERAFGRNAARQACEDQNHLYNRIELVSEVVSSYGIETRWIPQLEGITFVGEGNTWQPTAARRSPYAISVFANPGSERLVLDSFAEAEKWADIIRNEMKPYHKSLEFRIVSL